MSLFRKDIEPRCDYCARGSKIGDSEVACIKRGVVSCADHCRAFQYDPLKRVPPRPATLCTDSLSQEDFDV